MATRTLAALVFLMSCASPVPPSAGDTPGWTVEPDGSLLHVASSLRFPTTFHGLTRGAPHIYVASGINASVDYIRESPPLKITFYVYPREHGEPDPADEFRSSLAAVETARPGVAVHEASSARIGAEPRQLDAFVAGFSWVESQQSIGGWLLLVPNERWFYKIRSSTPFRDTEPLTDSFKIALELLQQMMEYGPG